MFKSYFRSLLAAFRESHRSVPDIAYVSGDPVVANGYEARLNEDHSYTAPKDGVFSIQAEQVNLVVIQKVPYDLGLDWTFGWDGSNGGWPTVFVPCKRGERLIFYTRDGNAGATVQVHWRFYPNVGE